MPKQPVIAILKRLADIGVPLSMVTELTGIGRDTLQHVTKAQLVKLGALHGLAEAYSEVGRGGRSALAALPDAVSAAIEAGVWYEPPQSAYEVIESRAKWTRAARMAASRARYKPPTKEGV